MVFYVFMFVCLYVWMLTRLAQIAAAEHKDLHAQTY